MPQRGGVSGCECAEFTASDTLIASADTERWVDNSSPYVKKKSIETKLNGEVRTYFEIKKSEQATTAYGRIYKNGVAFGTSRSTTSENYVSFSEDLIFKTLDDIEGWFKATPTGTIYTCWICNFRVKGDLTEMQVLQN